jgi:virulence-associated protein VapD
MSVATLRTRQPEERRAIKRTGRVYAIAFDVDTAVAEKVIGDGWKGCYEKIERGLAAHGFRRQQGSLFFGDESTNPVTCLNAVRQLDEKYAWFGRIVRDLRMLRIDEDSDMLPLLNNRLRFDQSEAA